MESWVINNLAGPVSGLVLAIGIAWLFIKEHFKSTDARFRDYQSQIDNCDKSHQNTNNSLVSLREDYGVLRGRIEEIERTKPILTRIENLLLNKDDRNA